MLHSPRSSEFEPANSATGYWSIAITSVLFLIVGVGVSEAGQKSPFSLNQSAFQGAKAYSKTPSSPSIDRNRLNRSLGSLRSGGNSRFSIDRSRVSTSKKKPKRRYGRRKTKKLPKALRVVRLKKTLRKRVSKSFAAITRTKPGRPVGVDLQATTVGPVAGLVMTLIPPTFDTGFARELSMLQHLKLAAQLSKSTLDLAGLRTPKGLGLTSPIFPDGQPGDETSPFNRDGPLGSSASLGHHRQPAGVGWKGFGFLNNSHNRPVPGAAPIGVTPDSIAGAMGGIAGKGQSYDTGWIVTAPGVLRSREFGATIPEGSYSTYLAVYGGGAYSSETTTTRNTGGIVTGVTYTFRDSNGRVIPSKSWSIRMGSSDEEQPRVHHADEVRFKSSDEKTGSGDTKPGKDLTKRYDPDSGDSGGWVPAWCVGAYCGHKGVVGTASILAGMERAKHELTAGPGQNHSGQAPRRSGPMVVSQHDLVAKYDPDSQNHGRSNSSKQMDPCRYALCGDGANWP